MSVLVIHTYGFIINFAESGIVQKLGVEQEGIFVWERSSNCTPTPPSTVNVNNLCSMVVLLDLLTFVCTCVLIPLSGGEGAQGSDNSQSSSHPARGVLDTAGALAVNNTIYVHVVPHTHDDVGWQMTVDEYYYECKLVVNLQQLLRG